MARIEYETWNPGADALAVIRQANAICRDFAARGYDLTLRQLYYQFVARALIPNDMRSYKRLGDIVNRARLSGRMDWNFIVDRTRNLRSVSHWDDPRSIIRSAARSFALDKWENQPVRIEVWVEKDALAGVVGQVATRHDVDYFACRGYVSQSELWGAAQRHLSYVQRGQRVLVLHLGDHDPSGIDMTRDIEDRLQKFLVHDYSTLHPELWSDGAESISYHAIKEAIGDTCGYYGGIEVRRIALNYEQVEQYNPPPNPAKLTDSRSNGYVAEHGYESWELDALDPDVLDALIEQHILGERDDDLWQQVATDEDRHRDLLNETSRRWSDVVSMLDTAGA